jgi:hypothetical protein
MAKGEIIAYLNADDTYLPDTVESVVAFFEKNPGVQMVYGDGIITDEYGKNERVIKHGEFTLKDLVFCRDMVFQPSVFLGREVLNTTGEVDVNLHLAMDLDYWLRIALVYKTAYLPKPLSVAKIYQDAKSSALMFRYVKEYEYILEKLFASAGIPSEILQYKKKAYTFIYTKGGLDYLHANMVKEGMSYLWKAFRMNPVGCMKYTGALLTRFFKKTNAPIL